MPLVRYTKAVTERKLYEIDYTNWLSVGEFVQSVSFAVKNNSVTSPLVINSTVLPTGLGVQYYVSGGVDGIMYQVSSTMVTTIAQTRLDNTLFTIREP